MPESARPPVCTSASGCPIARRPRAGRWFALALGVGLLSACSGEGGDLSTAATVGDWSLSRSELADLLVLAQPFPLEPEAAEGLARHWVGAAALAHRVATGGALADDEAVRAATWLERREAYLVADREDRLGGRISVDTDLAKRTYQDGSLRLLAHVLRRVGPETSESERELQRRTAQRLLEELIAGGPWDAAVAESEDAETRAASGLLGLFGPGELDPALGRVAFGLQPGQVSSVVQTLQGFHILYRPRFEDVRGLYAANLRDRMLLEADGASAEGLLEARGYVLAQESTAMLRRVAAEPLGWVSDGSSLTAWDGGTLPTRVVARYVLALPELARSEMSTADDEALVTFLEELSLRELRISEAEARGVALDGDALSRLVGQHADDMSFWREALALEESADDPASALSRYMERVVSRQVEARSLPPLFEAHLLDGVEWNVSSEGIAGAVAAARAMLGAADPAPPTGGTR